MNRLTFKIFSFVNKIFDPISSTQDLFNIFDHDGFQFINFSFHLTDFVGIPCIGIISHLSRKNSRESVVESKRRRSPRFRNPVGADKTGLDVFEEGEGNPPAELLVGHAEEQQAILHDIVEEVPVIDIGLFTILVLGEFLQ